MKTSHNYSPMFLAGGLALALTAASAFAASPPPDPDPTSKGAPMEDAILAVNAGSEYGGGPPGQADTTSLPLRMTRVSAPVCICTLAASEKPGLSKVPGLVWATGVVAASPVDWSVVAAVRSAGFSTHNRLEVIYTGLEWS